MKNLIKYEIKGYWKETIGLIMVVIVANLFLLTKVGTWPRPVVTGFCTILTVATMVVAFIWNIKNFSKDLNENTSYLIYALPVSSNSLLTSKLISSLIQYFAVAITNLIFLYHNVLKLDIKVNEAISNLNINFILFSIFYYIVGYLGILCTIYFSIALSKAAIKKKMKIAKLGPWIVFILISIVMVKISDALLEIFPQAIYISTMNIPGVNLNSNINIAQFIFDICIVAIFFTATSYILRRKLDV
ncbi:hypothetical protein BD780_001427 [Clostridium tetanomorphum]|uniref:Uncharacterized protein n=1 Tax=Clostridium tetanomorphum TaxID=1553 RepID=A0A923J0P3_CLOTT|nr:hypothetical protein [Clostridium tetanomorphum]KAJ49756.1 putative ABC transporter permease [Clostridium tetanomorphum DSM 665]KAJ53145.1 putative ABC transporter permease [Clostridium tetanomorphum DSM 665]MBC2396940.1 hypothetical protein [Clostridium tetanomorphum]MBP1863093.1 hypothetical protein [Clostridium tetanomorphum]NRS84202.1 hypothetical protein [Clostridium tetanomorphum]